MPTAPPFRLKVHDRYRVEVKYAFPITPLRPREDIRLETYLFIPTSLGIQPSSYTKDNFYQDLTTYTRYGTPKLTWEQLLDPGAPLSPFTRLMGIAGTLAAPRPPPEVAEQLGYELRVLACIFRANTRDGMQLILRQLAHAAQRPEEAPATAEALLSNASRVLVRAHDLRRKLQALSLPVATAKVLSWVDEAMSIQWEGVCGQLYTAFLETLTPGGPETRAAPAKREAVAQRFAAALRDEEVYRRESGYPSLIQARPGTAAEQANERFVHRCAMLKKFIQGVLFLTVRTAPGSRPLLLILYSLAAMAAMGASMLLLWLLQLLAPAEGLLFILLVLLAYGFKDRIKDVLKSFFSAHMAGLLRDREVRLVDRGFGRLLVGRAGEACSFISPAQLPDAVRNLHGRHELTELAEEGRFETILKYQQHMRLYVDRIFQHHQRVDALDEIVRLSVRRFLYQMDEPQRVLLAPDPHAGPDAPAGVPPLVSVPAGKVYHLEMILRVLRRDDQGAWQADLESFRLVLSRDGIERVEAVGSGTAHRPRASSARLQTVPW